tara:strand:+ start:78 stop:497 length:420 start_codon:yes stop_codon:yes gene_type:complete
MPYGREDEYTGQEAQEWEILQQNMPNASNKEKSEMFQRYKKEKHFAEREWGDFSIYDFLDGMGIDTNQNLPPDVQGLRQKGIQKDDPWDNLIEDPALPPIPEGRENEPWDGKIYTAGGPGEPDTVWKKGLNRPQKRTYR